jgi:arsenate reductase
VNQTITGATSCAIDGSRYASAVAPPDGVSAQVFGTDDSQPTRAALRFFKERRVAVHVVDIRRKPMAPGELRRFVERLGARALADEDGRAWKDAGVAYLRMDDAELSARLLADQRLLRLPLVRIGNGFAAGRDEAAWKRLLDAV